MSDKSKLAYLIDAEKKKLDAFQYYVLLTGDSKPTKQTLDDWALRKTAVRFNFDLNDLIYFILEIAEDLD